MELRNLWAKFSFFQSGRRRSKMRILVIKTSHFLKHIAITDNIISSLLQLYITGLITCIPKQYIKYAGQLNHSVIVITFMLAQNDIIKRRTLYLALSSLHFFYLQTCYFWTFCIQNLCEPCSCSNFLYSKFLLSNFSSSDFIWLNFLYSNYLDSKFS